MPIFISVDGVDGVGKTVVCKLLAERSGLRYYKSPSGVFQTLRSEVDHRAAPLERYCFYRLAVEHDATCIRKMLERGSVVSDRYIASTLAYHLVMDPRIASIHDEEGLLRPDFAFLLTARARVRVERMRKRNVVGSDIELERDTSFLDRVAQTFLSLNLIEVDTSDSTPDEVVSTIQHILLQGGG